MVHDGQVGNMVELKKSNLTCKNWMKSCSLIFSAGLKQNATSVKIKINYFRFLKKNHWQCIYPACIVEIRKYTLYKRLFGNLSEDTQYTSRRQQKLYSWCHAHYSFNVFLKINTMPQITGSQENMRTCWFVSRFVLIHRHYQTARSKYIFSYTVYKVYYMNH